MKKILLKSLAILMMLSYSISSLATSAPEADDGKWYYVKSQRYQLGGPWWTLGENNFVVPGALTKADNQKFTVVSIGEDGKVTIQSESGLLFNANEAGDVAGNWGDAEPTTGWDMIDNTVDGFVGKAFPGERLGIHQGSSGWTWRLASGWYSLGDNCTFFFYEDSEDLDLNLAIDEAQELLNGAVAGENPGDTPESAITALYVAITTNSSILGSTDTAVIQNALNAVNAAINTFKNAKVPFVESSTAEAPGWYLIKNSKRGGKGSTVYTTTHNESLNGTSVANSIPADGSGTGSAATKLSHLFRFERVEDGSYKILNAALPENEVLVTAGGGNSSQIVKSGTPNGSTWNLNTLGYNEELEVYEANIVGVQVNTIWHLDGSYKVVSWGGGSNSESAWYFEEYTGDVSAISQTEFDDLTAQYNALVDEAGNSKSPYSIGNEPGEYNADKFAVMKTAFNNMDEGGVSAPNIVQLLTDLSVAIAEFKASKVQPVAFSGPLTTQAYTLELVQEGAANHGRYLTNPRTDGMSGTDGSKPYTNFSENIDETTKWYFIAAETPNAHLIVSKRNEVAAVEGKYEYIDEEGRVRDASNYGADAETWTVKTLMQSTLAYDEEETLLIVKINNNNNYFYTGNNEGATLGRNGSNWSTFRLKTAPETNVETNTSSSVIITVVDRLINVSGSDEPVNVYSLTGAQINAKSTLNPGVYIVKVGEFVQKVLVK